MDPLTTQPLPPKDNSRKIMLVISVIVVLLACLMILLMRRDTMPRNAGPVDVFGKQAQARDLERKADINALHVQLEIFYNENGRYPSFHNINDSPFITANFQGIDMETFTDPSGDTTELASSPTDGQYSYEPTAGCPIDCQNYKLTATMETDIYSSGIYVKESLTTSGGGELLKDW